MLWIEEYGWFIAAATLPAFDYRMVILDPVTKSVKTMAPAFWPIEDPYGNNGFTYKVDATGKIILCVVYTINAKCYTATYDPVENSWSGWNSTGNYLGGLSPGVSIWHPQYLPVTKGISSGTSTGFYVNCGPGLAYVAPYQARQNMSRPCLVKSYRCGVWPTTSWSSRAATVR